MKQYMEQVFNKFKDESDFSGVCLITNGNDRILEKCSGMAHRGFLVKNNIDTMFDVASVTKVFTAAAILQLVENGMLGLDDKITEVLDLSRTKIPSDVKISQLLTHTSGIADDAEEELGENYSDLFVHTPNYSFRKLSDFLPNFVYKEPNFSAGTKCMYNNCAYILLGLVIEKLSNMDYKEYLTKYVFQPCGMNRTKFCAMDEIGDNAAENYVAVYNDCNEITGWKKNIYSYPPIGGTDGGVYTTANDLDSFIRNIDRILNRETKQQLFSPQCEFRNPFTRWKPELEATICNGFGFEFVEIGQKVFCIRKDGINEGVSAMLSYYPEYDANIIILSNQCDNVWELHRRLQNVLYDQYIKIGIIE